MSKPIYLYITPFFPSPESWRGGYCLDAAKAIISDGRYDVRVVVSGRGNDYEWDGIKVYSLHRVGAPSGVVPFLLGWINNQLLQKKLRQEGIDVKSVAVCHANTLGFGHYSAWLKRKNPSCKAIIQFHSSYSLGLRSGRLGVIPFHATLLYLYYRHVCKNVDVLAFVSDMSRRTFGKRYVDVPEGEVEDVRSQLLLGRLLPPLKLPRQVVVYNGIDTSIFYPKPKTPHEGFIIGCVANFQPLKDHMTLLRATNILKDKISGLKVRLVGSGETLVACKDYVRENCLGDIVTFEQEIDHRDMPDFYRSLDLFVMPSRLEGFLCVCVESWACGTPALFCEGTALPEIVPENEKGTWLFKPLDAEDLAAKIMAFHESRSQQNFLKGLEITGLWREFLGKLDAV